MRNAGYLSGPSAFRQRATHCGRSTAIFHAPSADGPLLRPLATTHAVPEHHGERQLSSEPPVRQPEDPDRLFIKAGKPQLFTEAGKLARHFVPE